MTRRLQAGGRIMAAVSLWMVLLAVAGCAQGKSSDSEAAAGGAESQSSQAGRAGPKVESNRDSAQSGQQAKPVGPAPKIDPARAMRHTREIVAFGPRPPGSATIGKVADHIEKQMKGLGLEVENDRFTAKTPAGPIAMRNVIAKIPGNKEGIIVLASHYDTNHSLRNTPFVGANDGAATSALLMELAQQLRAAAGNGTRDGYSVWLVWFDGEEAIREWSESDSLYGSRHLAERWEKDGTLKRIQAFILMDMIGDADLQVEKETQSTEWLQQLIYEAAKRLGYQSYFFRYARSISDDHVPFVQRGVPAVDLIDLEYGYNNVYHHTVEDTVDKVSPKSLQVVGDVVLQSVWMLDVR